MKRLLVVAAIVVLGLSSAALAATQNGWAAEDGAFDVSFTVFNNGQSVNGWFYAQWDVTLNLNDNGSYFYVGPDDQGIAGAVSIRDFEFWLPLTANGRPAWVQIDNQGAFLGPEGSVAGGPGTTSLDWSFTPVEHNGRPGSWYAGLWSANDNNPAHAGETDAAILAGSPAHFSFGLWSSAPYLDPHEPLGDAESYQTAIHVNTDQPGYTGWVDYTNVNYGWDSNPPPFPPPTPELSTWALLACSCLFGVGYVKRRKR